MALCRIPAGTELSRDRCPNLQFWMVLQGGWELEDGRKVRNLRPSELSWHYPKQPCRRMGLDPVVALSVEIIEPDGFPETEELGWRHRRSLYRLGHLALQPLASDLQLEEELASLLEDPPPQADSQNPAWLDRAVEIVRDRISDPPSLAELAREVGISPNHLCAQFAAHYGESITTFIRRERVQRSMGWIAGGVASDAWALAGFHDPSHYRKSVQRELGLNPSQLRDLFGSAKP